MYSTQSVYLLPDFIFFSFCFYFRISLFKVYFFLYTIPSKDNFLLNTNCFDNPVLINVS